MGSYNFDGLSYKQMINMAKGEAGVIPAQFYRCCWAVLQDLLTIIDSMHEVHFFHIFKNLSLCIQCICKTNMHRQWVIYNIYTCIYKNDFFIEVWHMCTYDYPFTYSQIRLRKRNSFVSSWQIFIETSLQWNVTVLVHFVHN